MRIWNGRMLVGQEVRKHIQCLDLDVLFGYLVQPFFYLSFPEISNFSGGCII